VSIPEVDSKARLLNFLGEYFSSGVSFRAIATIEQSPGLGQAISHDTTTTVEFAKATITVGSGYDPSTSTFTAPYSGKYVFRANVLWQNLMKTIGYVTMGFKYGGSTEWEYFSQPNISNGDELPVSVGTMLDLNRGDTVVVVTKYFDSSQATEHLAYTESYVQFYGYKI